MKTPKGLAALIEDGIVDRVVRQLQSGKEASVYLVATGERLCCAKVYKAAEHRNFKRLSDYQEGRKSRGSRNSRASGKRSNYGRKVQEEDWKNAEVEALYALHGAGVRVPAPLGFHDGVLLMELVQGEDGQPAPRLNEVDFSAEEAREWHAFMIEQVKLMLCAGLIHGDLSEFNVLVDPLGPVIIDLPQAVNASGNQGASRMLDRDVNNMRATFSRAAPELGDTHYSFEMWDLFEAGTLKPDTVLTGRHSRIETDADVDAVLDEIEDARLEAELRVIGMEDADEL